MIVEKTPLIDVNGAKHPVVAVVGKLQVFTTHLAKIWEHEDVWTYLNEALDIVEDQIEQDVLGEPRAKTVENRRKAQEQKRKDEEDMTGIIMTYLDSEEGRGLVKMGQRAGWWVEEEGGGAQGGGGEGAGLERKEVGYSTLEAEMRKNMLKMKKKKEQEEAAAAAGRAAAKEKAMAKADAQAKADARTAARMQQRQKKEDEEAKKRLQEQQDRERQVERDAKQKAKETVLAGMRQAVEQDAIAEVKRAAGVKTKIETTKDEGDKSEDEEKEEEDVLEWMTKSAQVRRRRRRRKPEGRGAVAR